MLCWLIRELISPCTIEIYTYKRMKRKDYIVQYWVGLMDGDGSIQVNHWRMRSLQYRLVIRLKLCDENLFLLREIKRYVGGNVKIESRKSSGSFLLWVENYKSKIQKIVKHLQMYPPLTTRLCLQLEFLFECLRRDDLDWYLANRDNKYHNALQIENILKCSQISRLPYYNTWLSGFIEAEGCFSCRSTSCRSHSFSFSISQKGDQYLLESIKDTFTASNTVRLIRNKRNAQIAELDSKLDSKSAKTDSNSKAFSSSFIRRSNNLFLLEIYRKDVLKRVISHCTCFPLLGEKNTSFLLFSQQFV